jgi:hypothetical protein
VCEFPSLLGFQSPAKIEGAEQIFDGVYLITSKPLFEQTISARPDASVFHVYLGYAGWTQEQLQKEVELGAWFIFPPEASTVFNADPDSLWLEMIRKTELQLAQSEPGNADPRTCAGQFAELRCKRWNSTHFGPVPPLAFCATMHSPARNPLRG